MHITVFSKKKAILCDYAQLYSRNNIIIYDSFGNIIDLKYLKICSLLHKITQLKQQFPYIKYVLKIRK